ncbi:MAG: 4-(cytidine 5'-diphospho)-2-C-methyl-D-erythritol kinase [Bacteroidales bacterium]|nr:4-(cytidine 5'-diphospho)-2-C-methyl-D-erythritol kinase [Bacteroidales bacterium]
MLRLPAPAKLNLFLHITGRRTDGYHTLQTLFQLLDYGDELGFAPRTDGELRLLDPLPGVPDSDNLVLRAAHALRRATGCALGADIALVKRLPAGGGLGGGSSDAATALLGLNQVWNLGLDLDTLAAIGLPLGADIPVFVRGRSAWAEGVGELLTPVDLAPAWYLVLCPGCQVATAKIFAHRELTRDALPITIRAFLGQGGKNHCQPVVEKLYPGVKKARQWLDTFSPAQMTGTGACVFARFDSEVRARAVLAEKPVMWQGFIARGVNQSPTHTALKLLTTTGVSPSG